MRVDCIVFSNHGAHILDGATASVDRLPVIVERVGHRIAVLADSGVWRSSDIAKHIGFGSADPCRHCWYDSPEGRRIRISYRIIDFYL